MPETVYDNPGPIDDVIADTGKIEDTWGNAIRDRVVNNFADSGERDTAITSPVEGMTCFVADVHELQTYNHKGLWRAPWNLQWGKQTQDSVSTDQTGITVNTAVSSLSGSWLAVEDRLYRVSVVLHMKNSNAGAATLITVVDSGGTVMASHQVRHAVAASNDTFRFSYLEAPALSGTTESIARGVKVNPSSGTLDISSSIIDAEIWVEDAGPS